MPTGAKPDLPTNSSAIMKTTAFSPIRRKGPICLTCVKYIPPDGAGYLSFGGEVRERFETYRNKEFSSNPNADNAYLLQRYLFHADYDPVMPDFYPLPILGCAGRSTDASKI